MTHRLFLSALLAFSALFLAIASVLPTAAQEQPAADTALVASHPLDALTPAEIATTTELLRRAGKADDATLYGAITLIEPPKDEVRAWVPGKPFGRRALVVMRQHGTTIEARVDVAAKKIEDVREVPGAQPMIMDQEWARARDAFMKDPRFFAALEKRGLKPDKTIICTPNSSGYFPAEKGEGRRILKVPCFSTADKLHPSLARPIEGVMGIVDSENGEVLDVLDAQRVDLAPAPKSYGDGLPKLAPPIKPQDFIAPQGPNIQLSGNINVTWLNWTFHLRPDKRAGLIVSLVRFNDGKQLRDMAYEMNVSEMFVPYMDPDPTWSYRTFMDAGEFGLGYLISSLEPGVDCPFGSFYTDLTFPNDIGGAFTRDRALCIFERPTGDPAWRHYASGRKEVTGQANVELVVRHIPTLGNYDYVVDYIFQPQGNIRIKVGATGFDAIKTVEAANMESPTAKADTAHGNLIAPYTVAPFHDHYFNFRLDLDTDGTANDFARTTFVPTAIDTATRKSLWTPKTQRHSREGPILQDHDADNGVLLRMVNPATHNSLKQNPSLWLDAHHDAQSILDGNDPPQTRARFTSAQFWVTRYKPEELWAAGLYPNLSRKDDGLPAFVGDQESITGQDLVTWYTMGFRHLTRSEDFPILPTYWHELTIRPAFFFDMDPAMTFNSGIKQQGQ